MASKWWTRPTGLPSNRATDITRSPGQCDFSKSHLPLSTPISHHPDEGLPPEPRRRVRNSSLLKGVNRGATSDLRVADDDLRVANASGNVAP